MNTLLNNAKTKITVGLLVLCALVVFALPIDTYAAKIPSGCTMAELQTILKTNYPDGLPRSLTSEEKQWLDQQEALKALTAPEKAETLETQEFGLLSAPTVPIYTPAEYEAVYGPIIAWEGASDAQRAILTDFVVGITNDPNMNSLVFIGVADATQQATCTNNFLTIHSPPADMDRVRFFYYNFDSIWVCDGGPRSTIQSSNTSSIIDHKYNRVRPNDDAFPAFCSTSTIPYPAVEPLYHLGGNTDANSIIHGGGNFLSFSNGDGFCSRLIVDENPTRTEAQIVADFLSYFNVNLTLFPKLLTTMDSTGHIDMWFMPIGNNKVVISRFPSTNYSDSKTKTDAAAAAMAARGYTVYRTDAWSSSNNETGGGTHYTYTNIAIINKRVFIPTYNNTTKDANALAVYSNALPGYTIVPLDCSGTISLAGAIHCIVKHVYIPASPYGEVLKPNGGETVPLGQPYEIKWIANGNFQITSVDLYYSTDSGTNWTTIATGESHDGYYTWNVPSLNTTQGRIKVVVHDANSNTYEDTSNANFTITTPPPTAGTVTTNLSSAARTSATFSHTVTAGSNRLLAVSVMIRGDKSVSSITYGGTALTKAVSRASGASTGCATEIWYLVAPTVGTDSIVVNFSASVDPSAIAAVNFTNIDQSSPIGATASALATTGTNITTSITTLNANSLIFGAATNYGGDTDPFTPGSGITELWDNATGTSTTTDNGEWGGYRLASTAGAYTFNTTSTLSDDWAIAAAEIKAAPVVLPPNQATSPSPANSATDVSITADLSWTAGSGATSHIVYFGTSSPGTLQGEQSGTTFDTGTMSNNTTYYWRIDEKNAGGTTTGTVWSFTTIPTRTLTCSSTAGGDVTTPGEGAFNYNNGTVVNIAATADSHYHFVNWTGTGVTAGKVANPNSASTTITMDANYTVVASFAIDTFTLNYAAGVGGSLTGSASQVVDYNTAGTAVTAVPDTGYHFVKWSDDSTANPRTDAGVTANISVTATFAIDTFTLNYAAGVGGSLTGSASQVVDYNTAGTAVTAVPDIGYHFVKWSDDSTANPRTDAGVTANISVTATFAIDTFTLNYAAGVGGSLTGSASQVVDYNTAGTAVTAVPDIGYHFVKWSDDSTANPRTDAGVTANVSVTASFAIDTFTLNYAAGVGGSLTGSASQVVDYNTAGTTVTAVPDTGYHFVKWSDDSTANPRTDAGVTANISVTASFAIDTFTLNYAAGVGGSLTGSASQVVDYNTAGTAVTAVPDIGYHFVKWSDDSTANPRTDAGVTANISVTATFAIDTFTLNYAAGVGGSLTGSASQVVDYNTAGTAVTAVPDIGYHFVKWSDDSTANPRTDAGVTANVSVTASFAIDTFTLNYAAGVGGSLTGSASQVVDYNTAGTAVTAVPDTGYHFVKWSDDSTANPRTDAGVTANISVTATFAIDTFTLNYAAGVGGSLTGSASQVVDYNTAGTAVTAVPDTGYHFVKWSDDSTANPRTDAGVTANISVTASFAIDTFTLNYAAGVGGSLTGSASQVVDYNTAGTAVTAVPDIGYHFVKWSDDSTANPRTDAGVTANVSVTASFAIDTFTLNYAAGVGGSLTGSASQVVDYNTAGTTVTAVPDTGYHFVKWSDDSTANPRTDAGVTANISVTASFAIDTFTLNYAAGVGGSLTGSASQVVDYNTAGTAVTAVPDTGYHFVKWSDDSTANPRTDAGVTANISVTATFAIDTFTLNYAAGVGGSLTGSASQVVDYNTAGTAVTAVPDIGYHFVKWSDDSTANPRTDAGVTANISVTATFAIDTFTLNYAAGVGGSLTGSASQVVDYNTAGTAVTAVPDIGYHFVKWSDDSTANPRTDAGVTANVSVTASFAIDTFTLNYAAGVGGSLTGSASQVVDYNTAGTTVTAVPDTGYHFVKWSDDSTANPRTDAGVTANISVTATFAIDTFTLNYAAGVGGSLTGSASQVVDYNTAGTAVTAVPDTGYHFVKWSDDSTANPRTDAGVTANISVTASFAIDTFTLNYAAGVGGSLTGSASQVVDYNTAGTAVTAVPDIGYHFVKWSDDSTANPRTDAGVTANISVTATFAIDTFTLNYAAGVGGSLTGSASQVVDYNTAGTAVTAVPDIGYHFVKWSDDSTANPRTDAGVTANVSVTASFAIDTFTLNYAAGVGGSLTGSASQVVDYNTAGTAVTAVPDTGYHFVKWSDDSTANPRTDAGVTANVSVTASFAIDTFTLNYAAGVGGSLTGSASQVVDYNTAGTAVTAVPDTGYHFVKWSDDSTANPRTDAGVTANVSVTASFAIDTFTLNYAAGVGGSLTGSASQVVDYNTAGTAVTAVPDTGYHFVKWSDDSTANPRTDAGVTANISVTASFAIDTFTLNYAAGVGGSLTGSASQVVDYNTAGTAVTAVPDTGYHFVKWSDDSTANPRTDAGVTANISVTASFAIDTFTLNYAAGVGGSLTGSASQVVDYNTAGTAVTAVPDIGYHFVKWSDDSTANPRTDAGVTANVSVTASFAIDTFTLNYAAGVGGSLTGSASQVVDYNTAGTTVTAVPDTGYHFVKWSDDSTANPRTDAGVTANISVTASFAIDTFTLNYAAGVGGSLTGSASQVVDYNTAGTAVTAVPDIGYHFVKWSDDSTANPRTDAGVTANISVTASFAIDTFTLNYAAGVGGSLTGSASQVVDYNTAGTAVTAVPDTGYHFVKWSDDSTANPRTDAGVTANVSVTASFAIDTFTLNYAAGVGGSLTGSASQVVDYNTAGTAVTAVPDIGYHFVKWSDDSTANPRTDAGVTANISVTATFAIDTFTLNYAAGVGGSLTGSASQVVDYNTAGTTVTAVPDTGYHFVKWSDDSTANPRTDAGVTANISVTASFAIDTFTLNYAAGVGGSLTGSASQVVDYNTAGTAVTAVPDIGYHFVKWSDDSTANPRTDAGVTANISVTASFAIDTFTLNYAAGVGGSLTGSASQVVDYNTAGTAVTAVPDTGYHFVKWSDDSTANPRTDAGVTANVSVTASFAIDTFTLNYAAGVGGSLTGSASQVVDYNTAGTAVTAVPDIGYHFVKWSDDSTANPRTDAGVTANISVTATFAIDTFTLNYAAGVGGSLTGSASQVVDYNTAGTAVTAVPDIGYHFVKWSDDSTANPRTDAGVTANISVTASFAIDQKTIFGYITEPDANIPVAGVSVNANNGGGSDTTDANGYYEVVVDYNWSGNVTPGKTDYTFEPNIINYNNVITDHNNNYIARLNTFIISGYAVDSNLAPMAGVLVSPDNDGGPFTSKYYGGSGTTDANGYYEVLVDTNWSGKVVPSKYAYAFEPNSITYVNVIADTVEDQNYVGTLLTYTITGYIKNSCDVPIAGVLVDANNGGGQATTDVNGFYEVWVDYNWSGTVTPTKIHYTFAPILKQYANIIDDVINQNYTAANIYDLDCDGSIGYGDIAVMAANWLDTPVGIADGDFNGDTVVNFKDYAEFANVWLTE